MLVEIYISKDTELGGDIGRVYLDTEDMKFVDEVKKYKCPIRMCLFLEKEIKNNSNIRELITDKEIKESTVDLLIDLSDITSDIVNHHSYAIFNFEKYIENTSYLDKYGNELELEECDFTQNSDSAYELELDNAIYKS